MNKEDLYFYRRGKSLKAIENRINVEIREFASNSLTFDELENAKLLIHQLAKKMETMESSSIPMSRAVNQNG